MAARLGVGDPPRSHAPRTRVLVSHLDHRRVRAKPADAEELRATARDRAGDAAMVAMVGWIAKLRRERASSVSPVTTSRTERLPCAPVVAASPLRSASCRWRRAGRAGGQHRRSGGQRARRLGGGVGGGIDLSPVARTSANRGGGEQGIAGAVAGLEPSDRGRALGDRCGRGGGASPSART